VVNVKFNGILCSLAHWKYYNCKKGASVLRYLRCHSSYPEDEEIKFLGNIGTCLQDCTALCLRRLYSVRVSKKEYAPHICTRCL